MIKVRIYMISGYQNSQWLDENYQQRDEWGDGDDEEAAKEGICYDGSYDGKETGASVHYVKDQSRVDLVHVKFLNEVGTQ